jgi:DNA polymerase I-like protein with 3'-5' exonuclease and polymerase domains
MGKFSGGEYQHYIHKAMPSDLYPYAYNLQLVKSIEELKTILSYQTDYISFDTETNGLDAEMHHIVGFSFCMDGKNAYYVAVKHAVGKSNLGVEALDLIYQKMCQTKMTLMFNMRFDCRMMEYVDFDVDPLPVSDRWNKLHYRFDMSKVNVMDIQALVYLADTNKKYPSLKWSEEWFLGWRGASFEDTLGEAQNFEYLDPEECYTYAATDALGTFLLYPKVYPFYVEAKTSGQLDNSSLFPLMRFEEETIAIDTKLLEKYSVDIANKMQEIESSCWKYIGYPFNLSSPKEKSQILDRLGISTGEKNTRGEWKTGEDQIDEVLTTMDKNDINYKFLSDLVEYSHLKKQQTSYVDNIIAMCKNDYHPNRLRFSYKTTEVPSGRLAAGGDKKNPYFAALNIQNIPKPHTTMWFYLPLKTVLENWPDVAEHMFYKDDTGKEHECREFEYVKRTLTANGVDKETKYLMTHILGFLFADKPFDIPGVQEFTIEGFKQDMNIRTAFMPDEGRYWVSIDYAAEELRVPTLITKEPVWLEVFKNNGDVHKSTAIALWGKENYTKDLRKIAKGANFGILYGQNEYNFAGNFNGDVDKARDFLNTYKSTLATLFRWVNFHQREAQQKGMVTTYFGRPIRLSYYFNHPDYGKRAYAKRFSVNATIQGTGADILKISFMKLWSTIFSNDNNRNKIKFCSTIHDEINYQITKEDASTIIPIVIKCMRLQLPTWEFPMDVGLAIGQRWGTMFDFNFDPVTFKIISPKGDPYTPKEETTKPVEKEEKIEQQEEIPTIEF